MGTMQTNAKSLVLIGSSAVVGDEIVMRQRRRGGDHLRAADDQAAVGFLFDVHVNVADLFKLLVSVHGGLTMA